MIVTFSVFKSIKISVVFNACSSKTFATTKKEKHRNNFLDWCPNVIAPIFQSPPAPWWCGICNPGRCQTQRRGGGFILMQQLGSRLWLGESEPTLQWESSTSTGNPAVLWDVPVGWSSLFLFLGRHTIHHIRWNVIVSKLALRAFQDLALWFTKGAPSVMQPLTTNRSFNTCAISAMYLPIIRLWEVLHDNHFTLDWESARK